MSVSDARQGKVWFCDLNPIRGREQAGRRPAVVVSVNQLGTGGSELAIIVPLSRTSRPSPLYVAIDPPEGGLRDRSYATPEMVRSISRERLVEHGAASRLRSWARSLTACTCSPESIEV